MAAGSIPAWAETPSQRYVETRLVLGFRVPDAALAAWLPAGWSSDPATSGPSAGVNLNIAFTERQLWESASGEPLGTGRSWDLIFIAPVRQSVSVSGAMVMLVLTRPENTPGPYGNAIPADVMAERTVRSEANGTTLLTETWDARCEDGHVSARVVAERATPKRQTLTSNTYSGITPSTYRTYRTDQGVDVLRGAGVVRDRVRDLSFQADGTRFAGLFDNSQHLVSITSIPWLVRSAALP